MKKIININLAGRVIPIEDSAYDHLQRYIESLRRYFANEEGRDEIINDIESRIAELMNDKIRRGASAITNADIEEIIQSMGRVEDFEAADASETEAAGASATNASANTGFTRPKGRLYRNLNDKFLGGVCSGAAAYLNVDPSVVRLLFAILAAGSFGFGLFLYVALWIFLPAQSFEGFVGRRLFRNPDDKIFGGVAGGLAAYFNWNVTSARLIFAAPLLLNIFFTLLRGLFRVWHFESGPVDVVFGSITSTFVLFYIVLWIVLPQARSAFEKMEMRGEKIDVNRIRQNVQEGMGDFKDRMQSWGDEVKDSAQRLSDRARQFAGTRGQSFAAEAKQSGRSIGSGIGHAIGVIFKAFFIFVAGSIALGLFVGLMVLIFGGGAALWPLKETLLDFILDGNWQKLFFWGTMIFFIAVPLVGFITWLIRRIMRVRSQRSYLGWTFGGLWTIGWFCLIGLATSVARDFSQYSDIRADSVNLGTTVGNTLVVTSTEAPIRYRGRDLMFTDMDNYGWNLTPDSLELGIVHLNVERSSDSSFHVYLHRDSRGPSGEQADRLAESIRYNISARDSVIDIGSGFSVPRSNKYRGQQVTIEIQVPVGKKLRFARNVAEKFNPDRIYVNGRRVRNNWRGDAYAWGYKADTDYTMQPDGRMLNEEDRRREEERRQRRTQDVDGREYRDDSEPVDTVGQAAKRRTDSVERRIRRMRDSLDRELERVNDQRQGFVPEEGQPEDASFDLLGSVLF